MDLRRLRPAEWLLTAAGILLIVDLFLPWYAFGDGPQQVEFTAWQAFSVVDVILFVCALAALLAVALQATQRSPALPIVSDVAATWAGFLATVLVVVKLFDHPDLGFAKAPSVHWGAWLGLVAVLGVAASGWMAMHDERMPGAHAPHLESSAR